MMLNKIANNARATIGGRFAWLLIRKDHLLISGAFDSESAEDETKFFQHLEAHYPERSFPLETGDNLLADVLLRNVPLVGVSVENLSREKDSQHLKNAFENTDLKFVTIIPLRYGKLLNGIIIIGHDDDSFVRSEHGQNLIKILRRQISLELNQTKTDEYAQQLENEEKSRARLYNGIIGAIDDGVLVVGDNNKVIYVNEMFSTFTGAKANRIIGRVVGDVIVPGDNKDGYYVRNNDEKIPISLRSVSLEMMIGDQYVNRLLIVKNQSRLEQHERALEHQTRRLRTLNQASRAINSPIALQDVIQVVLSSAYEVVSGEAAALLLRDDEDDLIVVATRGVQDMHGRAVAMGMGIIGSVAANAESTLVHDVEQDPRYRPYVDTSPSILAREMIAIPLITTSEVIGVLVVINCANGEFIVEDLEILENLGAAAATAIENATLFDQTNRRLTELSTMLDASAMVTSTIDLQMISEHITRRLREALDVQRVNIWSANEDTICKLVSVVDSIWEPERALAVPVARVPTKADALRTPTEVNLETSKLTEEEIAELRLRGVQYAMNIPLRFGDKVSGIITIYGDKTFSDDFAETVTATVRKWEQDIGMPAEELGLLCHHVLQATNSAWCAIYLLNATREKLLLLRELGTYYWPPVSGLQIELEWLETAKDVLKSGEIVMTDRTTAPTDREKQYLALLGIQNALVAPIVQHGNIIGLVELNTSEFRDFDNSTMSLTRGIANIIGNAIESSSLYTSLEQRAEALEAAYHSLEEADRLKDELLQNMSHELGTPLTHILGYLSLLQDGAFGALNKEQGESVSLAVSKTQHVAELVKQMVVVHASNAVNLSLKETQLEQLAALAVRTIAPKAQELGIEIAPRISRNLPAVMVDQVAMSEVFEALIDNAIKFSGEGKQIQVEIRDTGGVMLQVAIHDEGIGIPEDQHERVFRQFYQIDGSTTRTYGGMGLGLAIVRKIVEAHGGRVWIDTEVDQGTTVRFTVPKATSPIGKNQNVFAIS